MTIAEFKAWLEGFSEAMSGAPTAEQWATIKKKIAALQAVSVEPLHGYKWRELPKPSPWWKCPSPRYDDNQTVPLRAH